MTDDAQKLAGEFETDRLVRPDPSRPNPVTLARAVSAIYGLDAWPEDAAAAEVRRRIGEPEHVVLVLADGFGMNFAGSLASDSFSRSHLAWEQPAVFPSGTGPNMTSLLSGEWPAQHGFVGWWVYLPQLGERATVYEWVRTSDRRDLGKLGVRPQDVFLSQPFPGRLETDCRLLMPELLATSLPTRYSESGGAPVDGFNTLDEAAGRVERRVRSARHRTLTILYWNMLDSSAHVFGTGAPETARSLKELDVALGQLAAALRGTARMIITGDHGHLDVPRHIELGRTHRLARLLKCTQSGDGRVNHFHVTDGMQERFAGEFRAEFGDHFFLLPTDEILEMRLFGPLPPSAGVVARLGDFTAISRDGCMLASRSIAGRKGLIKSSHGGLTRAEMMVPVLLA